MNKAKVSGWKTRADGRDVFIRKNPLRLIMIRKPSGTTAGDCGFTRRVLAKREEDFSDQEADGSGRSYRFSGGQKQGEAGAGPALGFAFMGVEGSLLAGPGSRLASAFDSVLQLQAAILIHAENQA